MNEEMLQSILILSKQITDEYEALVDKELEPFATEIEAIQKAIEVETDVNKKLKYIQTMVKVQLQMEDARFELLQQDKIMKYTLGRITGKI